MFIACDSDNYPDHDSKYCCTSCHEDEEYDSFSYTLNILECNDGTFVRGCCVATNNVSAWKIAEEHGGVK